MGVNLFAIVAGSALVFIAGGAIGYFIWLKTRPKKQTWVARVYQVGEGIRPPTLDKKGNIISDLKLQDLRPLGIDVLEKIERGPGNQTLYRLQKLKKITPAPEADSVEFWGTEKREVSVLMLKDGCTILKKGYDGATGQIIFDPLPHSRTNIIKSELTERKGRLQQEKDILTAITPWFVAAICMFGLVTVSYVQISGYIEISENLLEGQQAIADALLAVKGITPGIGDVPEPHDVGPQEVIPVIG